MTDLATGADRLDLLRTFLRIVDAGSLSAAAVQLGTTQPTVSRRLQALEKLLGLQLLQRSTHRMKLTEDGERAFVQAQELLQNWATLEADLRGGRDEPRGLLRVVVPHAFGQDQLIAPLADFLRRHPAVSVDWLLHDRLPDFIAQGIDCALRVGPVQDPGLVAVRLAEVPRIVVASPSLWAGGEPPATVHDLPALPWLAMRTYYRTEVTLTHRHSGAAETFPIRPRLSTDSLPALRRAALAGLGAGLVSAWTVAQDLADGTLVQPVPDWEAPSLPVHLLYPPARLQPARLRAFVALLREWMPRLVGMRPVPDRPVD